MNELWIKVDKTVRYYLNNLQNTARSHYWELAKPIAETPVFILGCSREPCCEQLAFLQVSCN